MSGIPYIEPSLEAKSFNCPHCRAYSDTKVIWIEHYIGALKDLVVKFCVHCDGWTIWYRATLIWPTVLGGAYPHPDLPEDCLQDYEEARHVRPHSPRAAAAFLRLVLQKLMPHLGQPGKNINADIAALVKNGLSVRVQRALDVCRVTGNEAVHPGTMDLNDTPEMVDVLFGLVNMIVENQIAEPRHVDALWEAIPLEKRQAADKRDGRS